MDITGKIDMKNMEVPAAADEVDYEYYDIWADKQFCEQCQMNRPSYLSQWIIAGYFCFVPIYKQTVTRWVICEDCGYKKEISKADYREIWQIQHERLKDGVFPHDIIERDRECKKTECRGKLISFIFSLILMPLMIGVVFSIKWDWGNMTSDMKMLGFFVLLLTVYTFIPPIYSAWDYFKSKKELKLYKRS